MPREGQNLMDWVNPIPRKLDETKCALFDDFPYVSIQEKVLKAQASGQIHDDYIRGLYSKNEYDCQDPESMATELDDVDNGADAVSAYRQFMARRIARDKALAEYRVLQRRHSVKTEHQYSNQQVQQSENQPEQVSE